MNPIVIWLESAEADLLRLYLPARTAGFADEDTRAAERIERLLGTTPDTAGESRAGRRRILFEPPLTVDYEYDPDQQVVVVTAVRYTPPR